MERRGDTPKFNLDSMPFPLGTGLLRSTVAQMDQHARSSWTGLSSVLRSRHSRSGTRASRERRGMSKTSPKAMKPAEPPTWVGAKGGMRATREEREAR